jgi:hypothetical protein
MQAARLIPLAGRRRQPRTEVIGELHGHSMRLNRPVLIREVSLHGFSAETPAPFAPGAVESFQLTSVDGISTFISARAIHCRQIDSDGAEPRYVAGFAFLPQPAEALQVVVHVLGSLADAGAGGDSETTSDAASPTPADDAPAFAASRRRTPRFEVTGNLTVTLDDGQTPVELRDIGLGGFGLESSTSFPPRSRYDARFTDGEGLDVTIRAEAVHSRQLVSDGGSPRWMTGFTYLIDDGAAREAVETVLDRATSCLLFL